MVVSHLRFGATAAGRATTGVDEGALVGHDSLPSRRIKAWASALYERMTNLFTVVPLVKGHLDRETPRRFSPWVFHQSESKAAMMALGAACAGGLIVLRAWIVFAFPAKEILCIVLL